MRNGKHNVKMFYGQRVFNQVVNPESLFCSLAFGTVPVATTIVTVAHRIAIVTLLFVPSKNGGTTMCYFAQHL